MLSLIACILLSSLTFRIRGGLRVPFTDKKFPLNKYWFAVCYAILACCLTDWKLDFALTMAIACLVSTQVYGWGEAVGCLLCGSKPTPERGDCDLIDDILDCAKITIKGKVFMLTDFPKLWGWCWLSLRGLILTFIIGLALNSIPYMFCGLSMGIIYLFGGLFNKIIDDGKYGWKWSEWFFGGTLGIFLYLFA